MTVLEQRFMELMPRYIKDLTNEVFELRKEIAGLHEQLKGNENEVFKFRKEIAGLREQLKGNEGQKEG